MLSECPSNWYRHSNVSVLHTYEIPLAKRTRKSERFHSPSELLPYLALPPATKNTLEKKYKKREKSTHRNEGTKEKINRNGEKSLPKYSCHFHQLQSYSHRLRQLAKPNLHVRWGCVHNEGHRASTFQHHNTIGTGTKEIHLHFESSREILSANNND